MYDTKMAYYLIITCIMKTIVVPLDFSSESLPGLNMALMLADKTGANINMIHVLGKYENDLNETSVSDHQRAKLKFEKIVEEYKKNGIPDINFSYTIREGKIFKEVTTFSETLDDAVTILSTHGNSGFEELFIGGNAYKIISHSRCPVISVRQGRIPEKIKKIVLPLDITFQTREKVPFTIMLAKLFNSEVHIVSEQTSNYESSEKKLHQYLNQVASYINQHKIYYTTEQLHGDNLTDLTLDYANSVNADLISIMTEQEKSLSNLLLGSYAHQMINKALIPVLSFPNYQLRIATDDIWDLGAFNARTL